MFMISRVPCRVLGNEGESLRGGLGRMAVLSQLLGLIEGAVSFQSSLGEHLSSPPMTGSKRAKPAERSEAQDSGCSCHLLQC